MSEQLLRDRLADLATSHPHPTGSIEADLRRGRRRLRARRALTGVGSVAALSALVVGGGVVRAQLGDDEGPKYAAVGEDGVVGMSVVERCVRANGGGLDAHTFGAGSRVLTSDTSPSGETSAVVLSADGRTWGACTLHDDPTAEFTGDAEAYPLKVGRPSPAQETAGMGFGRGHFWYIDRFPSDVARVKVQITKGRRVSARTTRGFVTFARDIPSLTMDSNPTFGIVLYDARGRVLSDAAMAPGDASVVRAYRSLMPARPLPDGGAGR